MAENKKNAMKEHAKELTQMILHMILHYIIYMYIWTPAVEMNEGTVSLYVFFWKWFTLPEINIAPETLGLEDEFPFGKASCQVLC